MSYQETDGTRKIPTDWSDAPWLLATLGGGPPKYKFTQWREEISQDVNPQ